MLVLLTTLLACSASADLAMASFDAGESAMPAPFGACDVAVPETGDAEDLTEPGLVLYADGVTGTVLAHDDVEVVTDPARWAAIRAGTGWRHDDMPEVDLATTWLVVANAYAPESCSMGVLSVDRWSTGDLALHVDVTFDDRSAACEVTCASEAYAVVVVAVPAGTSVTTCARVAESCGS